MRLGRPADGFCGLIKSPRYSRNMFIFNFNVVVKFKICMLRRYRYRFTSPSYRRRVTRGKICACRAGTPTRAAPAERGRPLERSCGAGTPTRVAPADFGRSKKGGWSREQPSLSREQCLSRCACGAGDAGENWFFEVKLQIQKILTLLETVSTN
jgi:hypothetical protein